MNFEFKKEGYQAIEQKIQELEHVSKAGILDPDKAAECCRAIRAGLFQLIQIVRKALIMVPETPGPGRDAA